MMGVPQLFHCPNCNAGLDLGSNGAAVIRCEYCQSVVIVPESLRGKAVSQEAVQVNAQKPQRPNEPDLTEAEATARITALARSGQQIEAMKLYR